MYFRIWNNENVFLDIGLSDVINMEITKGFKSMKNNESISNVNYVLFALYGNIYN